MIFLSNSLKIYHNSLSCRKSYLSSHPDNVISSTDFQQSINWTARKTLFAPHISTGWEIQHHHAKKKKKLRFEQLASKWSLIWWYEQILHMGPSRSRAAVHYTTAAATAVWLFLSDLFPLLPILAFPILNFFLGWEYLVVLSFGFD